MGKRELLLIVAFALLGGAIYHVTAPPPAPGERSFSASRLLDHVRRELRGNRASADVTSTATQDIDAGVTELRVALRGGPIAITGEDRANVEVELAVHSNGADDAEAQQLAKATTLKFDRAGSILFVAVEFPEPGVQRAGLKLKVPSRLRVRLENNGGPLDISRVAAVELGQARGDTTIREISGPVIATHRGGDIVIADAGSLRLNARGSDTRIERIHGDATLNTQAGDLKTSGIAGAIELESSGTDVALENLEKTTGVIRINANSGSVGMRGLRTESRIDLRNADLTLAIDKPALIAINSDGGEPVDITVPSNGFRVDAITREAPITMVPQDLFTKWQLPFTPAGEDQDNKVSGEVNGGGPLLTVRTRQGSLTLREKELELEKK